MKSLMLPVRRGANLLWVGHHCPASNNDSLLLLVCHGGPGVPSDYLFPLTNWVVDAAIGLALLFRSIRSLRPSGTWLMWSLPLWLRA